MCLNIDMVVKIYTVHIFCRLRNGGDDDDNNNKLIKEIRLGELFLFIINDSLADTDQYLIILDTKLSTIEVDREDWADWREKNKEDCTRAYELSNQSISQYGPRR